MGSAIALFGAFENYEIRWNGNLDNPEWVAQDVAEALGVGNYRQVISRYPQNYKGVTTSDGLDGKTREMLTLTEPGLYRMVFASRKSEAEKFRAWVFEEVLPTIRKTGTYETQVTPFLHPDIQQFHQLLLTADLTATDLRVLIALKQAEAEETFENLSPLDLAEQLALHEATVYRALDRLRKQGIADIRTKRMMMVSVPGQENVLQALEE